MSVTPITTPQATISEGGNRGASVPSRPRLRKKWGGDVSDYLPLHSWFDQSKSIAADFRHRALRHHAEGIFMLETVFGPTLTLSTGRVIPTRYVGEQHVHQDLDFIPSFADWMRAIRPMPWMGRAGRLDDRPDDAAAQLTAKERPRDQS